MLRNIRHNLTRRIRRAAALEERQTRAGGGLTPLLYLERWGNMTNRLTPSRLMTILQAADDGDIMEQHQLFADMEDRCEHLAAEIGKRKRALLTLDWEILPGRARDARAETVAEAVREQFDMFPTTSDLLLDLADGIGHGFSALEIEWTFHNGLHLPAAFHHRPQSWFQVLREDRNTLRLRDGTVDGAELWPLGWVVHVHRAKSGWLPRAGLFRTIAWAYLIRAYALESAIMYTQVHGIPFRVGKYPAGSSDEDRAALRTALANLGRDASGIIPEGMEIAFESPSNATQDIPGILVTRMEQGMSKAILGGTLTTQADGKTSTNALGTIHNEVRHDILASDAVQIADTVSRQILAPLAYLNCGISDPALMPWFRFDTREAEDIQTYADALPKLAAVMDIPAKWAHEKLKIPLAEPGETVLAAKAPAQSPPATQTTAWAKATTMRAAEFPDQSAVDGMLEGRSIAQAAEDMLTPLLQNLRGLEPADMLPRLAEIYPALPTAHLEELMAKAIMLAEIFGEASAREEA